MALKGGVGDCLAKHGAKLFAGYETARGAEKEFCAAARDGLDLVLLGVEGDVLVPGDAGQHLALADGLHCFGEFAMQNRLETEESVEVCVREEAP